MIKGIPTKYKGVWYRTRLEARWAVFFDLVGWHYAYEPCDLNGWIPDFLLSGINEEIFVEVKPLTNFHAMTVSPHISKINKAMYSSGIKQDALLLGCILPRSEWNNSNHDLGYLGEYSEHFSYEGEWLSWGRAEFHDRGGLGFCHAYQSFHNRITGEYDGNGGCGSYAPIDKWNKAGNIVQWCKP